MESEAKDFEPEIQVLKDSDLRSLLHSLHWKPGLSLCHGSHTLCAFIANKTPSKCISPKREPKTSNPLRIKNSWTLWDVSEHPIFYTAFSPSMIIPLGGALRMLTEGS